MQPAQQPLLQGADDAGAYDTEPETVTRTRWEVCGRRAPLRDDDGSSMGSRGRQKSENWSVKLWGRGVGRRDEEKEWKGVKRKSHVLDEMVRREEPSVSRRVGGLVDMGKEGQVEVTAEGVTDA